MPPSYVKAYLKRGKNDAADAEAICEAVTRPNMRFVPVKSEEQQGVLVLHRGRELLVRQRAMLVNGLRAHMAEFGIIVPQGIQRLPELVALLEDEKTYIPQIAREVLAAMVVQIDNLTTSHPADGEAHRRLVSHQCIGAPACDHSGCGSDHRLGAGRHNHRPDAVPIRPPPCGVAWPGATPAFDRRQGQARSDHQNG